MNHVSFFVLPCSLSCWIVMLLWLVKWSVWHDYWVGDVDGGDGGDDDGMTMVMMIMTTMMIMILMMMMGVWCWW